MKGQVRHRIHLRGIVQGVGFRPHVARQAALHGVEGFCGNSDEEVFIEAQGTPEAVEAFRLAVDECAPPLSVIDSVSFEVIEPLPPSEADTSFTIVASASTEGERTMIPADGACCKDCIAELEDATNRRFSYPFITCTNCGPRLSIIQDLPYDRPQTTLKSFPLCKRCQKEYSDPLDRRFHAQPIGCFDCGPRIWLTDSSGLPISGKTREASKNGQDPTEAASVIDAAKELLRQGKIVAVKGLGGFTLMVDATNSDAVKRLRKRKARPSKPLAIMCGSLEKAKELAHYSSEAEEQLCSQKRPIVLAPYRGGDLAEEVCAVGDQVGIMLPSAAIHFLLTEDMPPLVATSANVSGEPLYSDNEEVVEALGHVVDAFLLNNRDIHHPIEDSVITQMDDGSTQVIRRARGYVPLGMELPTDKDHCVLGIGAELKNSLALTRGGRAFMGPHLADMEMLRSRQLLSQIVPHWESLHRRKPKLIVADMHPQYHSRTWAAQYAEDNEVQLLEIQHHHAHALSLFAQEKARGSRSVIAALDGTGWGVDQTIWGGEFLSFTGNDLAPTRVASLPNFRLIGGDSAARQPWKIARAIIEDWGINAAGLPYLEGVSADEVALVDQLLAKNLQVTNTTSMGRLFDAAFALCGLGKSVSFEAEGPIRLEKLARMAKSAVSQDQSQSQIPTSPVQILQKFVDTLRAGQPVGKDDAAHRAAKAQAAWDFHQDLGEWVAQTLLHQAEQIKAQFVGLTGGCAVNRLLEGAITRRLRAAQMPYVLHRQVPAGDGGLGLGQAWAGHLWLEEGGEPNVLCDTRTNTLQMARA